MKTDATNRKIRELIEALRDERLLVRPPFQRKLVWTHKDKIKFLKTILEDYPFPEIFVATGELDPKTAKGVEWLVDGQQRVSSIYEYFSGILPLKSSDGIESYSDLSPEQQKKFLSYTVVVRDLGPASLNEIVEVFERINSTSYTLNAMELENARYAGAFSRFGQDLADNPFFSRHSIFSAGDIRRMRDLRFALRMAITVLTTYFQGTTKLKQYLDDFNEEFSQAPLLLKRFDETFLTIDSLQLDTGYRVWQQADIFSVIVELYTAKFVDGLDFDRERLFEVLTDFYRRVETPRPDDTVAQRYLNAATKATNNRNSQIARGEILRDIIGKAIIGGLPLLDQAGLK